MAGGIDEDARSEVAIGGGDFDGAVFEAEDFLDGGFFEDFRAGFAGGIEKHFVEMGALDVERGRAGDEAIAEVEGHRLVIVAEAELGAVLGEVREAAQHWLKSQLLNQREVAGEDGLADVEAGGARFFE